MKQVEKSTQIREDLDKCDVGVIGVVKEKLEAFATLKKNFL